MVAKVGKARFDADLLKMEKILSKVCGNHSSFIGFWGGRPISFRLLRYKNDLVNDTLIQAMAKFGKSEHDATEILLSPVLMVRQFTG